MPVRNKEPHHLVDIKCWCGGKCLKAKVLHNIIIIKEQLKKGIYHR